MRVEFWNWGTADKMVINTSLSRVRKAAKVIEKEVRRSCPVGTISRPMYKRGKFAGQIWTKRDAGSLKASVRITERDDQKRGFTLAQFKSIGNYGNVRVYVGHYLAWYASIVEHATPFMRPAVTATLQRVKDILENG